MTVRQPPLLRQPLLHGLSVMHSPNLRDGTVVNIMDRQIIFGTRPWTDAERAGELARRIVRHGLADVLAWLQQPVGPAPTDPIPTRTSQQILDALEAEAR